MKTKALIDDLAIFGGTPAFASPLHVGRPHIPSRERFLQRVNAILERRWLTNNGPLLQEFEHRICEYLGVDHCVATANGTAALQLVIRAMELSGEVIVPAFTFIATAHALQWQGIRPVFCDVEAATHNLDPACVSSQITEETTAIIPVHLWGRPCDVERLSAIAEAHQLPLIFDAAHAFGCSYRGEPLGRFGNAEVFSFHATKFVNTFEGGAITTNDDALAARLRLMRNFGFTDFDTVESLGTNAKLNEISAAMGLTCLEEIEAIIDWNRRNYHLYRSQLNNLDGVNVIPIDDVQQHNYQYLVLEFEARPDGLTRDELIQLLFAENVLARRYFYPGCHRMEPYRTIYRDDRSSLTQTERLVSRVILLPTGTSIGQPEIETVCALLAFAVQNSSDISRRLSLQAR